MRELIGLLVEYADDLDDEVYIGGPLAASIKEIQHKHGSLWLQPPLPATIGYDESHGRDETAIAVRWSDGQISSLILSPAPSRDTGEKE